MDIGANCQVSEGVSINIRLPSSEETAKPSSLIRADQKSNFRFASESKRRNHRSVSAGLTRALLWTGGLYNLQSDNLPTSRRDQPTALRLRASVSIPCPPSSRLNHHLSRSGSLRTLAERIDFVLMPKKRTTLQCALSLQRGSG